MEKRESLKEIYLRRFIQTREDLLLNTHKPLRIFQPNHMLILRLLPYRSNDESIPASGWTGLILLQHSILPFIFLLTF